MVSLKPITHSLNEKLGGKWQYNARLQFWVDASDENRIVRKVIADAHDENSESRLCLYYEDNSKEPQWVCL